MNGTVNVSGAKNACLPLMAASLLVRGKIVIRNVPDLRDTRTMAKLLKIIGAELTFENGVMEIDATNADNPEAPYDLVKTMRASFYALGPLTARFGKAKISLPGGCAWGPRPVDLHLKGIELLGGNVTLDEGYIYIETDGLKGALIHLDISSVGATGNLLMASVLAEGETIIENAAREPEIVCLIDFLNKMGAEIGGRETNVLHINGVNELRPIEFDVIPDRIEAAVTDKLKEAGVNLELNEKSIRITSGDRLKATDITTDIYPGYPTDMQAQWIALMATAEGKSVVTDTVYEDRFTHVPELERLGIDVKLKGNSAVVNGVEKLKGAPIMSTDIRASASMVIAGLMAEGRTELHRIYHLDRGYEDLENKLRGIGADIRREKGPEV